jgi:hypothetical protein
MSSPFSGVATFLVQLVKLRVTLGVLSSRAARDLGSIASDGRIDGKALDV